VVPGKKYKPEDYAAIVWARRWLIIVPFVVATIAAIAYAVVQPDKYRAQMSILITPQQVPTNVVQSTVTTALNDRLQMIQQEVMSRTQLERIIEEFALYPDLRSQRTMEDVVEQMRRDIQVGIDTRRRDRRANSGAFTVGFQSDSPRTALLVTERLGSLFIRENIDNRTVMADATNQFLEAQLEEARRRLLDHEKKLELYNLKYSGSLPSQVQANLQTIQNTQQQLQALREATAADRDRRLFLERALVEAEATPAAAVLGVPVANDKAPAVPVTAASRLESARLGLRGLELRLKPDHPDIQRAKRVISDLEKEAEAEALAAPVGQPLALDPGLTPADRSRQARIGTLRAEIEAIDRRLAARQTDERTLLGNLTAYQARVEVAPARESELIELTRDYDILKNTYEELLRKSEGSKLAVNLERRQIGEQFKIVDGARLPERPVSPNRPRLIGIGAAMGLGLGLLIVGFLEYRDSTLKTDGDVLVALTLPVLAMIPAMVTKEEERAQNRRRRIVALGSAAVVLLVVAGAAAWKLQVFERWIG
jgi:polysaccharide chain length determinant protein (PEP-CTERM system associated)